MLNKGPNVPPIIASGIICLVAGAALGYGFHDNRLRPTGGGSPSMGMGGGMGGGKGGGSGQQPTSSATLTRMVRSLDTIQKVQNKGLTPQQTQEIVPVLKSIQAADKLPEAECATQLAALEKTLTPDQKQAITDLSPQRGGGGPGGGGGAAGGRMGGGGAPGSGGGMMAGSGGAMPPSSGGMMGSGSGMGGGMGAQPDPDRPFASDRNKKALEGLIASLEGKK